MENIEQKFDQLLAFIKMLNTFRQVRRRLYVNGEERDEFLRVLWSQKELFYKHQES